MYADIAQNKPTPEDPSPIDDVDRRIVLATQSGLPLTARPFHAIGDRLGIPAVEVMARMRRMRARGVIRRIAAVPNHYALGYTANAMAVWNVPDDQVRVAGTRIGALDCVSHCYQRPRHLPHWPYNLFAMVHGHTRAEVEVKVKRIADLIAGLDRGHALLFSTRILKKTGLRLKA